MEDEEPAGNRPVIELGAVKRCWPAPSYRKYQEETITAITDALNKKRVCVLDAPVGSGKSYELMAIAEAYDGNVFYTTPQNILIDQIAEDKLLVGKSEFITGRRNYICPVDNSSCDVAPCKTQKGYKCEYKYEHCPYWAQKIKAIEHKVCLTNFAYFITEGFMPEGAQCPVLGSRDLLIVDEGHNIEEIACEFISLTISRRTIPRSLYEKVVSILDSYRNNIKDFEQVKSMISDIKSELIMSANEYADRDLTPKELKDYEKLLELDHKIEHFEGDEGEWVWQFEDEEYNLKEGSSIKAKGTKLVLRPLKVGRFMNDLMWRRTDRIIIASGTPPTYPGAMVDIGLATPAKILRDNGTIRRIPGERNHKAIHVPSTFPIKNRPIINRAVGLMSRNHEKETTPKAIAMVDKIMHEEQGLRGIIHANSYRHAQLLRDRLSPDNSARLVFHESVDRADVLEEFLHGGNGGKLFDDRVLVSVKMEEGLDLKDDLARFQILLKVMYPNLTDARIRRRLELGERDWYNNITVMKIVQSYGRAVRSPDDWARYYVVDSCFYRLVKDSEKYCPPWFIEAIE